MKKKLLLALINEVDDIVQLRYRVGALLVEKGKRTWPDVLAEWESFRATAVRDGHKSRAAHWAATLKAFDDLNPSARALDGTQSVEVAPPYKHKSRKEKHR